MTSNNIKVSIKIRPLIQREKSDNLPSLWSLVDENTIKSNNKEYKLSFDHIFDESRKTEELFNVVAKPIVENAVKGINGTIFAYGQTSSGKTYCMMGTDEEPGIIPLTVKEIFKQIELNEDREFLIRVGYIEIYNEKIYDLLLDNKADICKIHETSSGEVVVNQTEMVSSSIQHILENYDKGNRGRRVGETCMNERSSRSHTLFRIVIESHENGSKDGVFQVSTLNLVDLAGSERVDQTKATGERLREGGHINKSLLSLSKVIRELSDLNDEKAKNADGIKYINYRDSKLTRILSASLGGNAMTAIICTITPVALEETYSTLTFASNAKKIKNQPKVNETVSDKVIMTRLQKEISELKGKLEEERSKNSEVSKIQKLISQIFDRESQIIHFQPENVSKLLDANRRRTWMCPSTLDTAPEEIHPLKKNSLMAPPPFILKQNSISPNTETRFSPCDDFLSNEIFQSPDKIQFGEQMVCSASRRNTLRNFTPGQIRTPRCLKTIIEVDSPQIGKPISIENEHDILKARIIYLENELEELQDFKMLEDHIMSSISVEDIKVLEENFERTKKQLLESEQKVEMLENDMMDKMIEIENLKDLNEKFDSMTSELKSAKQEKQNAEIILESIKYEYEQAQIKFKNREKDLLQCLNEARNESEENENVLKEKIKKLEQILLKTEEDLFAFESQKTANQSEKVADSDKLSDMEKNIKDLEIKLQSVMKEKERSEETLKEKNTEIETLSDQIIESVQEIDSLEDCLKKMEETLKLKNNEFEELTSKLTELEEISNRYQKIQQIVTVEETVSDYVYDENDETYKCIVELKQSTTKMDILEKENKQLISQIAENNRINEEVENLRKQISELEESINNKDTENEKLSSQLSQHENMTNRLQKIQNLLLTDEPSLNDDDNDDICRLIIKLHQNSCSLEADKLKLVNQINENQGPNTDIEELRKKIIDLEEEVNLKDSQKECLQSKLSELENIASHYQKVRDSLQSTEEPLENSDVIKQISDLHRMASRTELLENEKAQLLNEIAEIRQAAEILTEKLQNQTLSEAEFQLRERIDAFEVELKDTKERLDEQIVKNNDIESNNLDLQIKIEEILNEKEDLLSQIGQLRNINEVSACNNCNQLQDQLNESNTKIHAYENEISQLTSKLDELNIQNNELATSNKIHTDQLLNFETELKEVKEQLEHARCEKDNSESNDFDLQQKYEEVLKEKDYLVVKVAQLEQIVELKMSEYENIHQQLDGNVKKVEEFENEIFKLSLKLDEAKIETAKEMESKVDLQAKLDEAFKNNENSSAVIEQLRGDLESKSNELSELEMQLIENAKKIDEYKMEIAQLNSRYSSAAESSTDLHTQIEEILKDKESLLSQIDQFKEVIGSKDSVLDGLKIQLNESNAKINHYENEIAQLNAKYSTATESSSDLHTQIDEILKDKESLLSQIEQLKEVIGSKSNESEDIQEKLNENAKQISDYEDEISQLKLKFNEISTKNLQLLELNSDYVHQVSKLNAELINSQSQNLLNEEEFKNLQKELSQINEQLKQKIKECEELKTRYRRRSEDNERKQNEFEMANNKLLQQVGAAEAIRTSIENDLKKMKEEYEKVNQENSSLKEENNNNDMKYTILDEKYSQLSATNLKLEGKVTDLQKIIESKNNEVIRKLEKEIIELNAKLWKTSTENESKAAIIQELNQKCELLVKEVEENQSKPKKSFSPSHRRSDEKELFASQHTLHPDSNLTPSRALKSNIDRKTRRQSVYDERRDLSAWELTQSESTQTDRVDKLCRCDEFDEIIRELRIEVRLRDSIIANHQRMANVNIYKYQLEDAKLECQKQKSQNSRLRDVISNLEDKLRNTKSKIQELEINQRSFDINSQSSQTDDNVMLKDEYEKVVNEKNALEKKLNEVKLQLSQEKKLSEKENLSQNTKLLQNFTSNESDMSDRSNSTRLDYDSLLNDHKTLQKKYETAKRLCNLRQDDLNKLRDDLQNRTAVAEKMATKYEKAKQLCEIRMEKIRNLREQLGETQDTKEFPDSIASSIN